MPALIYLLKAETSSVTPAGGAAFAFAFAERVRRCGGQLGAENIQVPTLAEETGTLRMRARRLPDRVFGGFAYRMPAPSWFERQAPGSPFGLKQRGQVLTPDTGVSSEHLTPSEIGRYLVTTPFGRLCRHPAVRRALAQDRLARTIAPYLAVPDLLIHEDRLGRQWEAERPEAAARAHEATAWMERSVTGLSPELLRLRSRIRFAALRRIDAAAVGREVFEPCPAYFGEPYLMVEPGYGVAGHVAGLPPCKIGIVASAQYWPKPETEARSRAGRSDPKIVRSVETALFPPLALPESGDEFGTAVAIWRAVAPLREFERSSPLPLFPFRTAYGEGIVPPGFRLRIPPSAIRTAGGGPFTLAAVGLSPYLAEPFGDFVEKRGDLLSDWEEDALGLALGKWGCPTD